MNAGLAFLIGLVKALRSVHDEAFQGVGSFRRAHSFNYFALRRDSCVAPERVTWELEATEAVAHETQRKDSGAR